MTRLDETVNGISKAIQMAVTAMERDNPEMSHEEVVKASRFFVLSMFKARAEYITGTKMDDIDLSYIYK